MKTPAARLPIAVWLLLYLSFTLPLVYLVRTKPPHWPLWLETVSLGQLAVGAWLAWKCRLNALFSGTAPAWLGLLLLAGLQGAEYAAVVHHLPSRLDLAVVVPEFLRYTVLIGAAEELWFRGLWFQACGNRFWPAVVGGSALFGLYHVANGWNAVLTTAAVGFAFGVARHRGASLVVLTLAHALIDLLNRNVMPGAAWRFAPPISAAVFGGIAVLLGLVLVLLTPPKQSRKA